jgi:glycosyltransferase involved in cell wall biosynthesis
VLFAGLSCREKGLFDALQGVMLANAGEPGAFRFTAIGPFASAAEETEFRGQLSTATPGLARHLGFVPAAERNRLLRDADVFCFPSYYPHEGQPAVVLEALALDLSIITTRWRGIPENLPPDRVFLVDPQSPAQIAARLAEARRAGPAGGAHRRHYLEHFTKQRHHEAVLAALMQLA